MWYGKAGSRAGAVVHMRGQRPAGRSPRRVAPVRDGVTGAPAGAPARRALVSLRLGQLSALRVTPRGGVRAGALRRCARAVPVVSGRESKENESASGLPS